jgi:hypothetical protein
MSSRRLASSDEGERARAVERLRAAVAERSSARKALESAEKQETVKATASLRAPADQVAAREN